MIMEEQEREHDRTVVATNNGVKDASVGSSFAATATATATATAAAANADAGEGESTEKANGGSSPNLRKRKKSSRACDYCHINHQPCDNAKPKCGYCTRHSKECLYLRPQKKRGPAQGYRSALHTMRESAAAWGAALNLVPSLGPVLEGYLKNSDEARRLCKAIKDPQQQEFFIQAWQQSSVFKAFFGEEGAVDGEGGVEGQGTAPSLGEEGLGNEVEELNPMRSVPEATIEVKVEPPPTLPSPLGNAHAQKFEPSLQLQHPALTPSSSYDGNRVRPATSLTSASTASTSDLAPPITSTSTSAAPILSLDDIVARDAIRPSNSFSKTLVPLGFGPDDYADFLAMSENPEPVRDTDFDPTLGSEMDQKVFYELLMGKRLG